MFVISCTGCATILKGHTEKLTVESKVPNTAVYLDDGYVGQAPAVLFLDSKAGHMVVAKAPGYEDTVCHLDPSIGAGWLIADLIIMLPTFELGLIPDAMTGSWNYFDRDRWSVEMLKK